MGAAKRRESLIMHKMAGTGAETNAQKDSRARGRSSTRQAILAAARRVAEREGAEALTLNRVAAEAGFAPPAVYAHFISKNDLYLAVVADDLAALAQTMRGNGTGEAEPDEPEEMQYEAAVISLRPAEPAANAEKSTPDAPALPDCTISEDKTSVPPSGTHEQPVSLADIQQAMGVVMASDTDDFHEEDFSADTDDVPDAFPEEEIEHAAPGTADRGEEPVLRVERRAEPDLPGLRPDRYKLSGVKRNMPPDPMRHAEQRKFASPDEMTAAIAQLELTIARLEARPVDSWLERRLRVFERTLADIESRMEKAERDSAAALSTVSESYKAMEDRFGTTTKTVVQRCDESEQRQRAVAADLRMYVKDLSGRLSVVETGMSRLLGEAEDTWAERNGAHAALLTDAEEPEEDEAVFSLNDTQETAETGQAQRSAAADYLSTARQAARNAAAKAELSIPRRPLDYLKLHVHGQGGPLSRRTLKLVAGILGLVVALIGTNIAMHSHATVPAQYAAVQQLAAPSPDARIAELAKNGNPKAELIVAMKFLNGDGVATDVPTAVYWLNRAALKHEPVAEYWLGTLYERGRGVAKSGHDAMQRYGEAARAGNAKAMYRLAVAYADGWDGEPDYSEAARWFTRAANLGVIDAQFNLAILYERGEGVPQNPADAFKWYAIAAGQGDAESKSRLDALATQIGPSDVAAAQKAASTFAAAAPDPSSNDVPAVADIARLK